MRYLRLIENPTPAQILEARCGCSTDMPLNAEIWLVHHGEDGQGLSLEAVREFNIEAQQAMLGEMHPRFANQEMHMIFLEMDYWDSLNPQPEQCPC